MAAFLGQLLLRSFRGNSEEARRLAKPQRMCCEVPVLRDTPTGEGDSAWGTHLPPHNGHEFTQGFEKSVQVKNTNFCPAQQY